MIFIIILVVVAFVLFLIAPLPNISSSREDIFNGFATFYLVIAAVLFCVWIIAYPSSFGIYADRLAFQETIKSDVLSIQKAHGITVDVGKNLPLKSQIMIPANGLANLQHSKPLVEMINSLRMRIQKHNEDVVYYQRYKKHWFIRQFIAKVPEELKVIRLEDVWK